MKLPSIGAEDTSPREPDAQTGYRYRVVTVSTRKYARKLRGEATNDESGQVAQRIISEAGGIVTNRRLISDDVEMLKKEAEDFLRGKDDVAVFVGGTGVSHDDVTIESVRPFFDKELDGFGEILRSESYDALGSPATLTRATAGVAAEKLIVCLPGSPDAVEKGLRMSLSVFGRVLSEARA